MKYLYKICSQTKQKVKQNEGGRWVWKTTNKKLICKQVFSLKLRAINFQLAFRYRAVLHPWKPRFSSFQTTVIIVSTWLLSFLLVLPYSMSLKIQDGYCKEDWSHPVSVKIYTMGLFVFQFALPLLIITVAYIMVAKKLRQQATRIERNRVTYGSYKVTGCPERSIQPTHPLTISDMFSSYHPPARRSSVLKKSNDPSKQELVFPIAWNKKEERRLKRTAKITKMLVTVVAFYAVCMLPNQVVWLWYEFGAGENWEHFLEFRTFGSIMVYVNSCVNPLLYAGMNEEFRNGFGKFLFFLKHLGSQKTVV